MIIYVAESLEMSVSKEMTFFLMALGHVLNLSARVH